MSDAKTPAQIAAELAAELDAGATVEQVAARHRVAPAVVAVMVETHRRHAARQNNSPPSERPEAP